MIFVAKLNLLEYASIIEMGTLIVSVMPQASHFTSIYKGTV